MDSPSDGGGHPEALAARVLARVDSAPPTLGRGRLLCIDGLAGAGKSTLARAIAAARPETPVLGTDEMLHGWRGLPVLGETLDALLRPLATGRAGRWRRWDWVAGCWAEEHRQGPVPLLVLEGVGSASAEIDDLITLGVWLEADRDERLARGLARDGAAMREHWLTWMEDEAEHHRDHRTRERADVHHDTSGPDRFTTP
ncbi:4-amino-4-deoxy-L-arabinose transferase [Nocardioides sp. YIM 152588]|uniref:uridine kinase family protein n=1 Tax=Nocardioides sp. YIM 152588 TaxID=3158259 RepID=UPI0032E3C9E9